MSKFDERCSRINDLNAQIEPLRLEPIRYATSYLEEAVKCFHERLPISCIVVSSALVERTLFWQFIKQHTPKAGDTMTKIKLPNRKGKLKKCTPNLGFLFWKSADWDILFNSLLDRDEQTNIKGIREEKAKVCEPEKTQKLERHLRDAFYNAKYVETRNLFAHGKELLLPMPLTQLLPADTYASSEYGIDSKEWFKPTFETVAYVHLSKTLRFMKDFTDLLIIKAPKS